MFINSAENTLSTGERELRRKKLLAILLLLLFGILFTVFLVNELSKPGNSNPPNDNPPIDNTSNNPPELVIPESPIGTVGLVVAFTAALSIFALFKRRT